MPKNISIKNLSVVFPDKVVLDEVSLGVVVPEKICVVGENGAGKSTLLKVIAGAHEPSDRQVIIGKGVQTFYMPQEFPTVDFSKTVEEFIKTNTTPALFNKVLIFSEQIGLKLTPILNQECRLLSGGQQKILSLATALANNPDFLLLDEPENHLDIVARQELMALLSEYKNSIIFISHDRSLMNTIAEKVIEISKGELFVSEGGYESYLTSRQNRIGSLQRTFDSEEKRIKQLEKALIVLGKKAFRGKDVALYNARKRELEAIKQAHKTTPRARDEFTKIKLRDTKSRLPKRQVTTPCRKLKTYFS